MSQVQIQPQIPKLNFDTWGTCGQYDLSFLILPNDERIDPRDLIKRLRLYRNEKTKTTIRFGEYEVTLEVVNDSSRKNAHYKVNVIAIKPIPKYIIVVSEHRTSGNFYRSVKVLYADGKKEELETMTDIIPEEKKNERYIYKYEIHETYVKVYDKKHVIKRERIYVGKELLSKPKVIIKKVNDTVYVRGDTYYVKDRLKELKMRYDSLYREWYGRVDLEEVVEALKDVAEIEVKG